MNMQPKIKPPVLKLHQGGKQEAKKVNVDDGFTAIPNELLEAILQSGVLGWKGSYLLATVLKTLKWHKECDWFSHSQVCEMMGIEPSKYHINQLSSARTELIKSNILFEEGRKIGVNLAVFEWSMVVPDKVGKSRKSRESIPEKVGNTKETITKQKINNHLNPPTEDFGEKCEALKNNLVTLLEGKFNCSDAKALHDNVEQFLVAKGFHCQREYPVSDRGDGRKGRVDLMVTLGEASVGIELDANVPREKSAYKLNQCPAGLIILRNGVVGHRQTLDGILVISANSEITNNTCAVDYQAVLDLYNHVNEETGSRLPIATALNDKRKRSVKKFLAELKAPTLACAENYFYAFFEKLRPFHIGENDRDWRANFDYAIRSDVVLKVREGAL